MPDKKKFLDYTGLSNYHNKLIKIIDNKIDWNNLKNKPFYEELNTHRIEIKPAIYTGDSSGGFSPIEIDPSYILEGDYPTLSLGQSYNVIYKDTVYENVPVKSVDLFGTNVIYLGNWDSVILRSDLVTQYPDRASLVDGDLPFLFGQTDGLAVFAFFTDGVEDQTITVTKTSDTTQTCTLQIPANELTERLPFMESIVTLGGDLSDVIKDGDEVTLNVDGTDISGSWKVFTDSEINIPVAIFVTEELDLDALLPTGTITDMDSEESANWPCLVVGMGQAGLILFGNLVEDTEDSRTYSHISFEFQKVDVTTLEKKYLPKLKLEDLDGALEEGGEDNSELLADLQVEVSNGNIYVTPSGIINYTNLNSNGIYLDCDDQAPEFAAQIVNKDITVVFDDIKVYGFLNEDGNENITLQTDDYNVTINSWYGFSFELSYNESLDMSGTHIFQIYLGEYSGTKRTIKAKYLPDMSSDWAENDSSKSSYIKNRTHWEETIQDETASLNSVGIENPENPGEEISLWDFKMWLRDKYFSLDNYTDGPQLDDTFTAISGEQRFENLQLTMYHKEGARAGDVYYFGLGNPNKSLSNADNYIKAYSEVGCSDRINESCDFFVEFLLFSYSSYARYDEVNVYKTTMGVHKLDSKFIDAATLSDIEEIWNAPLISVISSGGGAYTPGIGVNPVAMFTCLLEAYSDTDPSKCGYIYYDRNGDTVQAYWLTDRHQDPQTGTDIANKITESPMTITVGSDGNWPDYYEVTLDIEDLGQTTFNSGMAYYK